MRWLLLSLIACSIGEIITGLHLKRIAGPILLSSCILGQCSLGAHARDSDVITTPCPGKYCRSDTKLNVIHSLGIPGISDRKFRDRKEYLKVDTWDTFTFSQKGMSSHEFESNQICYIDEGKFEVLPDSSSAKLVPFEDLTPVSVVAGDFVVFPKGMISQWNVERPVMGHVLKY